MCLYLEKNSIEKTKKLKEKAIKEGKPIIAYKIVLQDNIPQKIYISPLRMKLKNKSIIWNIGKERTSNRRTVGITHLEKQTNRIDYGLHFFKTRQLARQAKRYFGSIWGVQNIKILQVEINPNDFVAIGFYQYSLDSLVAKKATPIKVVR